MTADFGKTVNSRNNPDSIPASHEIAYFSPGGFISLWSCSVHSFEANLDYMFKNFGFYFPDAEYLKDPEGLLKYLVRPS